MKWLSDAALDRLRASADLPDLGGTRYRLSEKLGEGGMGAVYRVEDTALARQVALKVINAGDSHGQLGARLLREAQVIARLEHPGIVPVHDVGTLPDGRVFYTMKLVQGKELSAYVAGVTVAGRLRVLQKICETVSFAHSHGVLHRDLKPQNIMVGRFGEVLVMDWGLAKLLKETDGRPPSPEIPGGGSDTGHGAVLGTPGFMAPEQARGDVTSLDHRADIYSLGAILKFLLAGIRHGVPRPLAAIATKATTDDPGQRYASVREFASDIANYADGLPVAAYPEGPLLRMWRWMVKHRAWILLVLAYLAMRALLLLWRGR